MLRDKFIGALVGTAVGDSFGLPFECGPPVAASTIESRSGSVDPWGHSDDTEMMIGLAEALLGREEVDPEATLRNWARHFEPARGYGRGMRLTLRAFELGGDWEDAAHSVWPEGSQGNGAISRIAPVACRFHRCPMKLTEQAALSSRLSHSHPLAVRGAELQAAAISRLLDQPASRSIEPEGFVEELLDRSGVADDEYADRLRFVSSCISSGASGPDVASRLGLQPLALDTVPAAIYGFLSHPGDFRRAIETVVALGGDTDSIGASCGALAGAYLGFQGIPTTWVDRLEKGPRGRAHLVELGTQLYLEWESAYPDEKP